MIGLVAAEPHRGHEHQHVHDQVDLGRITESPVGARDVREEGVEKSDDRRDHALGDEDVLLDPV